MTKDSISLKINGEIRHVSAAPHTPLLYVLRNDLGLVSSKFGCGLEQCGACNVLIDGQAVPSCGISIGVLTDTEIITLEGLSPGDQLHDLQQAFIAEQAIQCGYCVSGMIVSAHALLNRVRYPTDDQIREALDGNLCRCGTHERVLRAIKLRIARPESSPSYAVIKKTDIAPLGQNPDLPKSLQRTPGIDSWIRLNAKETVTMFAGKVEIGQGILTAFAQIVADELDVDMSRIRIVAADTEQTPDEGLTVGSMSLETTGNAFRYAAAEVRGHLLSIAVEHLEAQPDDLSVQDGIIIDQVSGRQISYWDLMGGKHFGAKFTGGVKPKSPSFYQLVGQSIERLDIESKVSGRRSFLVDLDFPNPLHARVLRPPSYDAKLISVDTSNTTSLPGVVDIVQDGSFLAVVAEREEQALAALETLRENVKWEQPTQFPPSKNIHTMLLDALDQPFWIVDGEPTESPPPSISTSPEASHILEATYTKPYTMHASLGPSAAAAHFDGGKLTVWTHSQGVFLPQQDLAQILKIPVENIRVLFIDGPGCYGHNGANDAVIDAALIARRFPDRHIKLQWSRSDEHQWEPYSPPAITKLQAGLDEKGHILDWNLDLWSYAHFGRRGTEPTNSAMVAAWHLAEPFARPPSRPSTGRHGGEHRNADPYYDLPNTRIVNHFVPDSPLRTSSFRGLGAFSNIFAIESFMDELALRANIDPVKYRQKYLADPRAVAVIEAAAEKADWGQKLPAGVGRGMAFSRYKNRAVYAAIIVEASADADGRNIKLHRAVIAADAGQVVNPDGLSAQLEGGFIQAASMTLKEIVNFGSEGIDSVDWETYPILKFTEIPRIETVILNRPGLPFLGAGEAAIGPTPAAIANAVFNAVGIRWRDLPLGNKLFDR